MRDQMIDWMSVGQVLFWLGLAFIGFVLYVQEGLEKEDSVITVLGWLVMAGGVVPLSVSLVIWLSS